MQKELAKRESGAFRQCLRCGWQLFGCIMSGGDFNGWSEAKIS